jgi:type II secretory pathway pseudopilin PulG
MNPDKTTFPHSPRLSHAYTLIEALVASSILVIGIGAAASMSLAFVTQEEISERANKAFSHLDNAVALYQAGVPTSQIPGLLPPEPVVTSLTFTDRTITATNLGAIPSTLITVTWTSTGATDDAGTARWTGGVQDTTRTASVEAIRTNPTLAAPLPRVDFFD